MNLGLIDEDEEISEITDRNYWETQKGSPKTVKIVDEALSIIQEILPGYELKYNKFYIGLAQNGRADNFVLFRAKRNFMRMEIRLEKSETLENEIENKGIELTLFGTPVKTKNFSWDMSVNWTKNTNKVISLFDGIDNLQIQAFQGGVTFNATVGEPYGTLRARSRVTDGNGNYIIASSGYYKTEADQTIGNVQPAWLAGINNTLKFGDLSLGFLIDMRKGGTVFSLDQYYGMGTGLYPETVGLNAKGNPKRDHVSDGGGVLLEGVTETGEVNTKYVNGDRYSGAYYWGRGNDRYAYDASYIKLREASLGYAIPKALASKIAASSATLSVFGRNLWIIQKNTPYSDPEEGLGAGNVQGYQAGSYPTVKVYGVKLNLNF